MQLVLKILSGLVLGLASCWAWFLGVVYGIICINGFMNVINGMKTFSRSRGSFGGLMALNATARNPLRNAGIDSDTAMIILAVIAILTLITLVRAGITSTLRGVLGHGFGLLSGGVMILSLSLAGAKWLTHQPWMMTFFVGVAIGYGIHFLSKWLLAPVTETLTATPTDAQ